MIPRCTTGALGLALASHLVATAVALRTPTWIPAWQWALLAFVDVAMIVAAWTAPTAFTLRDFRLPGVFTTSFALVILVPLPATLRRFGNQIPLTVVPAIAIGMAALTSVVVIGMAAIQRAPAPDWLPEDRSEPWLPLAIVGLAIAVFPVWLRSLPSVPILALVRGTSVIDAAFARDAALAKLGSTPLRLAIGALRNVYLMFAVGWMVSASVVSRHRRRDEHRLWVGLAVVTTGLATLYAVVTTERLILGEVALVAIVAGVVSRQRPLTMRQVALAVGAVAAFPILFGLRAGAGGLADTLVGLRRRVLFVPDDVMARYFVEFPAATPYLRGATIPKLSWVTGRSFDLSTYMYQRYFQTHSGLVGRANASFVGVGWANGGPVAVVGWCVAVGIALVIVERLIRGLPMRSGAAVRGVAVVQAALLTSADVSRTLLGFAPGLLDLVVAAYALCWIDRRLRVRRPRLEPLRA